MITISLTNEEAKLLKEILMSAPMSGNVSTLTKVLSILASILTKLDDAVGTTDPSSL
jgi:hypothetical protein